MAGVYISFPFCAQKCTYCNFASGVFPRELEGRYYAALDRELASTAWPWVPETVYFGGGTPSQMPVDALAAILARLPRAPAGAPWPEATMEAAPGSFSATDATAWQRLGINRVSLGVQSFITAELRRTGRKHTAETVAADVEMLRDVGIANINLDLIAGLAGQTAASWEESLDWIERLAAPHVSVYMLEVDEDSRLGLEILDGGGRYGARDIPSDETIAQLYERAVERLAAMGIERYEISNFARPGAESLHNLKYWRLEEYLGFGADAHSLTGGVRWQNQETALAYTEAADPRAETSAAETTPAEPASERFFVGLRLTREGVEPTPAEWERWRAPFDRFLADGLLERSGPRIRLTPRGVLYSNEVFQEFLAP